MTAAPLAAPAAKILAMGLSENVDAVTDLPELLALVEPGPAAAAAGGDRSAAVLIVATAARAGSEAVARRLRGLARGCDVALVVLDAPLTAVDLTARVVADLAPALPPDLVPEFARRVAAATLTAAVLNDVSRLHTPAPSLLQHARSYLPGACFVVTPDQRIVAGREAAAAEWKNLMAAVSPVRLAGDASSPAQADFLAALPGATATRAGRPGRRDPYWGARNWLEVAWLTQPAPALAAQVDAEATTLCGNCARRSVTPVCPYCSAVTRPPARPAQGWSADSRGIGGHGTEPRKTEEGRP